MASSYSMKNVAGTIDGQPLGCLWDGDDAVTIAPLADAGTMMIGANGCGLFSQTSNEGATITLKLMHTSTTHRLLSQKWARQKATGIRVSGFSATFADIDSGEGGSADDVYIQKAPTTQYGVNASVREWVLVTDKWVPSIPNT